MRASSTLNRRAMQPALAGRHKQRTLPPVYATLGWSRTEGFFHRPIPTPRKRNPQPGRASRERRPWPEVALTAWAGKGGLGSRQASRDTDSGRGQQVARGSSKWKRFLSSLSQRLRPAAGYRAQDRNLTVGERPGVRTRFSSLRSPRLYFSGPSPAGRCDLRREGFLGPLGRAVWVRSQPLPAHHRLRPRPGARLRARFLGPPVSGRSRHPGGRAGKAKWEEWRGEKTEGEGRRKDPSRKAKCGQGVRGTESES